MTVDRTNVLRPKVVLVLIESVRFRATIPPTAQPNFSKSFEKPNRLRTTSKTQKPLRTKIRGLQAIVAKSYTK